MVLEAVEKVEDTKESLIYCGGNFPNGRLASYTVFKMEYLKILSD